MGRFLKYKKGYEIYIAFIVQREDCDQFTIANDIDPRIFRIIIKSSKEKFEHTLL